MVFDMKFFMISTLVLFMMLMCSNVNALSVEHIESISTEVVQSEDPFKLSVDYSTLQHGWIDKPDNTSVYAIYIKGLFETIDFGEIPEATKYFGISFGEMANSNSYIKHRNAKIDDSPWTTLDASDFSFKTYYQLKPPNNSTYFHRVYYTDFATIPQNMSREMKIYVELEDRPERDNFMIYFGTGSTVLEVDIGTDLKIVQTATSNDTSYVAGLDVSECKLFFSATNSSYNLSDGLVLHTTFDRCGETAVWTAWDYSGNNNHGTPTNMNQSIDNSTSGCTSSGNMSRGCDFDGVDDYVDCGQGSSFGFGNNSFTISQWIKPKIDNSFQYIYEQYTGNKGIYLSKPAIGNIRFKYGDGNVYASHDINGYLNDNIWNHVVAVHVVGGNDKVYINSVNRYSESSTNINTDIVLNVHIGNNAGGNEGFNGTIDNTRIYNKALSSDEINALWELDASKYITNYTQVSGSACTYDTIWNSDSLFSFKVPETGDIISATPTHVSIDGVRGNDGLVASYLLNYPTGSVAHDSTGQNPGTITNAVWSTDTPDGTGSSLSFDGAGDYVECGNDSSLFNPTQATYSIWFKPNEIYNSSKSVDWDLIRHGSTDYLLLRLDDTNGKARFFYATGSNVYSNITTWDVDTWYYLVGTFDNSLGSENLKMYVNGILINSEDSVTKRPSPDESLQISKGGTSNVTISSVNIWNRALTSDEILDHYTNGLTKFTNITDGMNTTNADYFGQETVTVTQAYLNEQNLTRVRISNPYAMNQYDLLDFNLTSYLGWDPNDIQNVWYDSYTGNTDNSTLKDESDYVLWEDSCNQGNTSGQVLCMNFNELQGTTAKDQSNNSANNNDGTLTNMNTGYDNGSSGWTTSGKYGNALEFDGVDDYVDLSNDSTLKPTSTASWFMWVKLNKLTSEQDFIRAGGNTGYILGSGWTSSKFRAYIYDSAYRTSGDSVTTIIADTWYYVGATYDKDAGSNQLKLYVNGVNENNGTATGSISWDISDIYIGKFSSTLFNGTIDEVRIYSRALSQTEITAAYEEGLDRLGIIPNEEGGITAGADWDVFVANSTISTTAPTVSSYYQLDSTNTTVDFGVWTEGFVSVNWNLTDTNGINASSCSIKIRNKNIATNYTNLSIVDDSIHPDYDAATGYKDLVCYTSTFDDGTVRVSANMTRSYDWRPLITALDQDIATHDNSYANFGAKTTKMIFHNITSTINTTFIFYADIDNQTATVADLLFYSCNSSYSSGDFTSDSNCVFVGAVSPTAARDVNFGYLIGALETDENGEFGGVVHTETMYGMSYCPSCTNANNAWLTYSTNGYDGHSSTSSNGGSQWTDLSGEEFNVILHVIDNTQLEFNLTISDNIGNELSDLQIDIYGALVNRAPFGDIQTDNVTGGLVSYRDINCVAETGTIWINTTISDPNADDMNCSIYLLNNDSSVNTTLLSDYAIASYGICPYEWDTTTIPDGDYRLNVTAFDGSLTGYDESAGYIRVDNSIPVITIITPTSETTTNHTQLLNISVDDTSTITYSIDGGSNITLCTCCTDNSTVLAPLTSIEHTITVYATNTAGLLGTSSVTFTIFDINVNTGTPDGPPTVEEEIEIDEKIFIGEVTYVSQLWIMIESFINKTNAILDYRWIGGEEICIMYKQGAIVDYEDLQPVYGTICKYSIPVTMKPVVFFIVGIFLLWLAYLLITDIVSTVNTKSLKAKFMKREYFKK